tara:strand:+ start:218 stop:613 length:396 start_codon:yes stop_codon:yes gene_type:complete
MAHFAEINDSNIVTRVLVISNDDIQDKDGNESEEIGIAFLEKLWGGLNWKQTSYNTSGGNHSSGGTPLRKNYAGVGYTYSESRDAFIPPKPYDSWTLNESTCQWEAPEPYPDDGKTYNWNEDTTSWDEFNS